MIGFLNVRLYMIKGNTVIEKLSTNGISKRFFKVGNKVTALFSH